MAYTKQTWSCGETITADKLNHMEDGIAEGGGGGNITFFPLTYDGTCFSTTASYNDVLQAMENGLAYLTVVLSGYLAKYQIVSCSGEDTGGGSGDYNVVLFTESEPLTLNATRPEDPLMYCPPTP